MAVRVSELCMGCETHVIEQIANKIEPVQDFEHLLIGRLEPPTKQHDCAKEACKHDPYLLRGLLLHNKFKAITSAIWSAQRATTV